MKLSEIQSIIKFDFDFADNEIDAIFYTELDDILPKYAKKINVLSISNNYVICDFTKFIKDNKKDIINYIYDNYYLPWASDMRINIFDNEDAEYIAQFIEKDMDNFLRGDY